MTTTGLVTLRSKHDFDVTVERLLVALKVRETTVFARIDHADGAASIQLPLRPTTLLIFGNAKAGTPLMQAAQTAGIDLPLKMLVWQDAHGAVNVSYNDPSWIAARHHLGGDVHQTVATLTTTLDALAQHAVGS